MSFFLIRLDGVLMLLHRLKIVLMDGDLIKIHLLMHQGSFHSTIVSMMRFYKLINIDFYFVVRSLVFILINPSLANGINIAF